jgi:hypothetical protein
MTDLLVCLPFVAVSALAYWAAGKWKRRLRLR